MLKIVGELILLMAKPLCPFFPWVIFLFVLFSHRCRSYKIVHCKLTTFCRTFTALKLPLVFSSSVLQMDGTILDWTELFSCNLRWMAMLLDGWKLGEFATVNKEWRNFKRSLEEVEKVEEGPQRGLDDTCVNGWLMEYYRIWNLGLGLQAIS